MRVYEYLKLDADGNVLEARYSEYVGEVAQCGGGDTTTTTTTSTPDYAYNARLASIAEKQQGLSDKFYNWWETVQAPVEEANAKAQLSLIDDQTQIAQEGLDAFKGIQSQYYAAAQPTSVEAYAGRGVADTQKGLTSSINTMNRNQARMGVSPNSGAATSQNRSLALQSAASLAGAANSGRQQGENANYQKLAGAMQYGLQG